MRVICLLSPNLYIDIVISDLIGVERCIGLEKKVLGLALPLGVSSSLGRRIGSAKRRTILDKCGGKSKIGVYSEAKCANFYVPWF
jgi:hypothetical protein